MDKAVVLALDARRRIRDARKEAGVKLSDVKRAISAELREIAAGIPKADDVAALVLGKIELPQPSNGQHGKDGRDGKDGKSVTEAEIAQAVAEYLKKNPPKAGKEQSLLRLRQKVADTVIEATLTPAIAVKTAAYTATASDGVILVDTTGGAVTITMPLAVNVPRQIFTIKRIAGSANVTIARTGTDVFEDSQTSLTLTTALSAAQLVADADRATYWVI